MTAPHLRRPRTQRTRDRLLGAFNRLFLARGFANVAATDIAAQAGVGRSTLYTHFRGPLELLEASLEGMCQMLARTVRAECSPSELLPLLAHLRERAQSHREEHLVFFNDPVRALWSRCLARAIMAELRHDPRRALHRPAMPREWLAPVLADLILTVLARWLSEPRSATTHMVAGALCAASRRLVAG
jgi:AcrR family transcriptional regulator